MLTGGIPEIPSLAIRLDLVVEIPTDQRQLGTESLGLGQDALGRMAVGDHGRTGTAQNSRLLMTDRFPGRPQPGLVIEADTDYQSGIGVEGIDRIQAPAEPHLQQCHLRARTGEVHKPRQCRVLEVRQGDRTAGPINGPKVLDDVVIARRLPAESDAFIEPPQVWRCECAYPVTRLMVNTLQQRNAGALAIGAPDGDDTVRGGL